MNDNHCSDKMETKESPDSNAFDNNIDTDNNNTGKDIDIVENMKSLILLICFFFKENRTAIFFARCKN